MASTSPNPPASTAPLPAHVEKILHDFVAACGKSFAERLSSIVLFGSAAEGRMRATSDVNVIVVLKEYRQKDVADMAQTVRLARAVIHLDVMYLLVQEVHTAVECFAQKFGDIVRRHRMLHGADPFAGLSPSRGAEIYRLRQVIFTLQLRLRQGYAERAGQEDQVALLLADVAGPLRTCAATLARLENQGNFAPKEALERLVTSIGRAELVTAIRDLSEVRERRPPVSGDLTSSFFLILEIVGMIRSHAWRLE
jgi:predicted nucleotidyltransferase